MAPPQTRTTIIRRLQRALERKRISSASIEKVKKETAEYVARLEQSMTFSTKVGLKAFARARR